MLLFLFAAFSASTWKLVQTVLTPKGLKLIETYPGVDVQRDILDRLPFEVEL